MAPNIKNRDVEWPAAEVAKLTGEGKTEAVARPRKGASFLRFLEEEVWPGVPEEELGHRLSKQEREEILGYGPEGM